MVCKHDVVEMDIACSDGYCPLCLSTKCEVLRNLLECVKGFIGTNVSASSEARLISRIDQFLKEN